jgi:succinate dehydrogenase/fumarate reductase flavoprotein subunit
MASDSDYDVVVIGAGGACMSAALEAARSCASVGLLEACPRRAFLRPICEDLLELIHDHD